MVAYHIKCGFISNTTFKPPTTCTAQILHPENEDVIHFTFLKGCFLDCPPHT